MADAKREFEEVSQLVELLRKHKLPGGYRCVRSDLVIPDGTNRERTGLSLEHVHFIASRFEKEGFRPRQEHAAGRQGHDVPVLVCEAPPTPQGVEALRRWRDTATVESGFPPPALPADACEFYTSLGNGHFTQALNLFRFRCKSIYSGRVYDAAGDRLLTEALRQGVPALVLSNAMTPADRKFVSLMLNKTTLQRWTLSDDGHIEALPGSAGDWAVSQFEALSKNLDADELSALVRTKLGIDVDEANRARPSFQHAQSRL